MRLATLCLTDITEAVAALGDLSDVDLIDYDLLCLVLGQTYNLI